jgi:pyridoxal phosphate enzyme (YggS family)
MVLIEHSRIHRLLTHAFTWRHLLFKPSAHASRIGRIIDKRPAFHPFCCNMATKTAVEPLFFKSFLRKPVYSHPMSIIPRYHSLKKEISDIKQDVRITPEPVLLLGASKTQSPETIEKLIESGLHVFGENRVQEAEQKWPALKKCHPHVELHLIGPLQSNKVKAALALFDVIQTVDRPKLAEEIAKLGTERKKFFIQVNTGEEEQKSGIAPKDVDTFITYCLKDLKLPVVGLMCIPPVGQPPAPHFALLYEIAKRHGLKELSMGMSEDYQTAIRMGSTCVRLGRALFGERNLS